MALIASLAVGLSILIYGLAQAWVPAYFPGRYDGCSGGFGCINGVTFVHTGPEVPATWSLDAFDAQYAVDAVVAAIGTFLLIALLRVAWRSFR
jgi:hypothetical protein